VEFKLIGLFEFLFNEIKDSLCAQNQLDNFFAFAVATNLPKLESDKYYDMSSAKERIYPSVQFAI